MWRGVGGGGWGERVRKFKDIIFGSCAWLKALGYHFWAFIFFRVWIWCHGSYCEWSFSGICLWWWLPLRLSKRQSTSTTVLLRTTLQTRTITQTTTKNTIFLGYHILDVYIFRVSNWPRICIFLGSGFSSTFGPLPPPPPSHFPSYIFPGVPPLSPLGFLVTKTWTSVRAVILLLLLLSKLLIKNRFV